jgi:hypothetical protein
MLGVGGAAAVTDQRNLVAGAGRCDHRGRDLARIGKQRRIAVRKFKCGERLLQMGADRIVG